MTFTPETKTTGLKVKVACHHCVGGNRGNHEGEVYFEGGHSLLFIFFFFNYPDKWISMNSDYGKILTFSLHGKNYLSS